MKKILFFIGLLLIGMVLFMVFLKRDLPLKEKQTLPSTKIKVSQSSINKPKAKIKTVAATIPIVIHKDTSENFKIIKIATNEEERYYKEKISRREKKSYIDPEEEVYQDNNQIFLNIDGEHKKISVGKDEYYMPMLSSSKSYLSYEDSDGIIIQNTMDASIIKLGDDASNVSWHPNKELIVFVRTKDDGASLTASEVYLYDIVNKKETAVTHTKNCIETDPIFSEDGSKIYTKDDSTEEIISINIPVN